MDYNTICLKTHALTHACNMLVVKTDMNDDEYSLWYAKTMLRGQIQLLFELAKASNTKKDEVLATLNSIFTDAELAESGCKDIVDAYMKE